MGEPTLTLTCTGCGVIFRRKRQNVRKGSVRHFHSRACYYNFIRGDNHHNYKGGKVRLQCEECGTVFFRERDKVKDDAHHFCSPSCSAVFRGRGWRKRGNPNYGGGPVRLRCDMCGRPILQPKSRAEGRPHHFCSQECCKRFFSGKRHPFYKHGKRPNHRYGAGWRRTKELVRERDGHKCSVCGRTREELGRELDVHHIKPWRRSRYNGLDNLVGLCPGCHTKVERGSLSLADYILTDKLNAEAQLVMLPLAHELALLENAEREPAADE